MNTEIVSALRANLDKLSSRDQGFARSLLAARFVSARQEYWIGELSRRATGTAPAPAAPTAIADVSGVLALLQRGRLKRPAIMVHVAGHSMRLSIAGGRSRFPGSVVVTSEGRTFEERTYRGRIADGAFVPSPRVEADTATAIGLALQALARDPAAAAAEYGRLTGYCCFCNAPLTTTESTGVGYGPDCATRYGLPWGKRAAAATLPAPVAALPAPAPVVPVPVVETAPAAPMGRLSQLAMLF